MVTMKNEESTLQINKMTRRGKKGNVPKHLTEDEVFTAFYFQYQLLRKIQ